MNPIQRESIHMLSDQTDSYFERISAYRSDSLDIEYLTHLHKQHISHIPFENLDIMAGKAVSLNRTDLFHKIITHRRGGVCSEINTLYNWFLESLGFQTVSYSARIIASSNPVQMRSHRIISVALDGKQYITDAGFNFEHHRIPLLLRENIIQDDGECQYRFTRDDFWGWIMWQNRPKLGWRKILGFIEEPHIDLDFIAPTFFAERHPDSKINKFTKVSLYINGTFYAVRNNLFLKEVNGVENIIYSIKTKKQEEKILREIFLLPL